MKRIFYIFLILFFVAVCTIDFTYAQGSGNSDNLDDVSPNDAQKAQKAREATENYCDSNKKVEGCIYDKNSEMYTTAKNLKFTNYDANYWIILSSPYAGSIYSNYVPINIEGPIKLTRGYTAFDGNGNAIFAGCYRIKYTETESDILSLDSKGRSGTYFLFQIITKQKDGCSVVRQELVPAKGVNNYHMEAKCDDLLCLKRSYNYISYGTWDGATPYTTVQQGIGKYGGYAQYHDWVASEDGDCPKVFGYTANTAWYTADANKYSFSEDTSDFDNRTYSFMFNIPYVVNPGCTVEDEDGKQKNEEILSEIVDTISDNACPDKIEDMNNYNMLFESWYQEFRTDNNYRVLWSKELIDDVTIKNNEEKIKDAITQKLDSCQYELCKITSDQKKAIQNNKGPDCKERCKLERLVPQSDSEGAKCYCCHGRGFDGCVYQYTDNASVAISGQCELKEDVKKEQCIGTSKDQACRECVYNAYKAAKLSDDQMICMSDSELMKNLTESNLELANKEAAQEDVKKEVEDNKEARKEIYNRMVKDMKGSDIKISDKKMTCTQILGKTLSKVIKGGIIVIQIVAGIVAVLKGMMVLIPPLVAKDAEAIKKASGTLVKMGIILVLVLIFRPIVRLIGTILDFDITCII